MKVDKNIVRQFSNVVFSATQIVAGYFWSWVAAGESIRSQSDIVRTPVIPAGYAFSIWSVIFLFSFLYAIYQALPSKRENRIFQSIGFWTAGAFLFCTIWEIVAQSITFGWPTAVIITIILVFSLKAFFNLLQFNNVLTRREKWLVKLPVNMLAGWVSMATFANISSVLKQIQFNYFGIGEINFSIILILLATILVLFILLKSQGDLIYGLTIIWALLAIFWANYGQSNFMVSVFAVIMLLEVTGILIFVHRFDLRNLLRNRLRKSKNKV